MICYFLFEYFVHPKLSSLAVLISSIELLFSFFITRKELHLGSEQSILLGLYSPLHYMYLFVRTNSESYVCCSLRSQNGDLRKPALVHPAYAKVLKKLNFRGLNTEGQSAKACSLRHESGFAVFCHVLYRFHNF